MMICGTSVKIQQADMGGWLVMSDAFISDNLLSHKDVAGTFGKGYIWCRKL